MSSGIVTPPLPTPETPVAPPTQCEVVIQERLQQTQRHVKGVDIAGGLMTLSIGVLAYLLAAAAVDHWLVVGGLGFWGRLWLWLALVGVAGAYFARRLLPPLLYSINPIYAAATIERSRPSLKNSLINFLLLRGRRQEVAPPIYQAMERRAAVDLSNVEIDVAVDRTHVIRLGYVLVAVLAMFCLYLVLSPKSPIRSAARILWPWSSIEAPTRVTIRDVQPGDAAAFHGDFVTISAEVAGLHEGEPALVIYSTADRQTVDQAVPMTRPEGDYRHQCRLPPESLGLQQDITYHLAAGDCRTRPYRIEAEIAPAIVVDKVSYRYPSYTGIANQTIQRQGDLRAIEGTEITIHATANTEIKSRTAEIDLGCTGQRGLRMTTDGRTAVGHFTLRLDPKDATRPEHDCYQLRFADPQGRENQRPIRHRVEVIRDLPPEAQLVEPQQDEVQVAADGKLTIKVSAEDPDFGLRRVTLWAQRDGKGLLMPPLLDKRKPEKAWPGQFSAAYSFEPARLGLKKGDRVEYWVEAEDNKEPDPGRAASGKKWIVIVAPNAHKAASDGRAGENANGEHSEDKAATDGRGGEAASGEKSSDQQQLAQASEKTAERIDPDADPGDAMQEILKDRQKKQEQPPENKDRSEKQQAEKQQSGDQQQSGEKQQGGGQQGDKQQTDKQSGGDKSGGEKASGEKSGNEKTAGEKSGGEKAGGQKSGAEKGGSEKQSGEKTGGEEGGQQSGEKTTGEQSGTEKGDGEKSAAEKSSGQQGADQKHDGEKSAKAEPGADATGGEKSGEQQPGQQASPGEGKNVGNNAGSPAPQNDNQVREKKPGRAAEATDQRNGDVAQSPSTSKKQSDSRGETAGDRSGGGEQGGGQQANKPGVGGPGAHTAADEGGAQANEPGAGEIGNKAGDQATAKKSTGSAVKKPTGEGPGEKTATGSRTGETTSGPRAEGKAAAEGRAGETASGKQSEGKAATGGKPGVKPDAAPPPEPVESQADQANLEYARRQSELALEHLREQLAKGKPELLQRLGWSEDDARRFLQRWEQMKQAAAQNSPTSDAARKQFNDALRSLGLRPRGTELHRGGVAPEAPQNLRDAGRFAPPPDWAEQFREYTRGVAGGERQDK